MQKKEPNYVISNENQSKQIWLDDQTELPLKANSLNSDIQSTSAQRKEYAFDWGAFVLIEFLGSCQRLIGEKYKTALDIGSGFKQL